MPPLEIHWREQLKKQLTVLGALIITTSHGVLATPGATEGPATGVAVSEMTHPYYVFLDGGMDVDVASIRGGEIPIDPQTFSYMIKSPEDERYLNDSVAQAKLKNSIPIAEVDIDQYDIVFLSGGWGPPTTLRNPLTLILMTGTDQLV